MKYFALVYNRFTKKIDSMVVQEYESEKMLMQGIKLFWYQKKKIFDIGLFNLDVRKMQELLNKSL